MVERARLVLAALLLVSISVSVDAKEPRRIETDLLIVGGTESGWAAAIQAARLGVKSITIVHDGEWLGGQFTEQALACVDENKGVGKVGWGVDWHPMKRSFHRSGLFKELMDRIETFNTNKYGSPMPGKPYHGPSTFRPAEAEAIFREMLQPYIDAGQVTFIKNRYPVRADVDESGALPRLNGLSFATVGAKDADLNVKAKITVDASDWGEAIQVSGTAFEYGPDPPSRYGEPSAPKNFPANEMNPITWAMIVEESDGETPIPKPSRFDDRNYPRATHFSRNFLKHLEWDVENPGAGSILHWPPAGKASSRQLSVYTVRRIVDGYTSNDGKTSILLNYMNGQDYPLERLPKHVVDALEATEVGASKKNIVVMSREQRQIIFGDAKQHALGVLYHLQNFVHHRADDKTNSFRRFQLSREFGTPDHLPPKPYIRESLRLKAMYMMREQDGRNRDGETKRKAKPRYAAVIYPDGLFAWQFHYDFHRTGRTYLKSEGNTGPWIDYHKPKRHTQFLSDRSVFPLRSLIPEKMNGLLGAQGNVGFSSIVSAAIRLHDQRIHVGQAAGATAAIALRTKSEPREFVYDREKLEAVRHALCGEVKDAEPLLLWPFRDLPTDHPNFVAINRLAALGVLPMEKRDVDFQPDEKAKMEWVMATLDQPIVSKSKTPVPIGSSRGAVCQSHWETIKQFGWDWNSFERKSDKDADGDGILDKDDALLFTPNKPIRFEIDRVALVPDTDGLIPNLGNKGAKYFNFCGAKTKLMKGFQSDHGLKYTDDRGFGWSRDISANNRQRNEVVETYRDTFLFTRTHDVWEYACPNGGYRVTVCVGDAGHEQIGQTATVEGKTIIDAKDTAEREWAEGTIDVDVSDGQLTIEIGQLGGNKNTCLNWVIIEPLQ